MKKVAIVARAPSSRYRAPFHDESWEIWTLSPMGAPSYTDIPRWDRWYEIHQLDEKEIECPGYIEFLKLFGDRVWLREPHPKLPKAQLFPRDEIIECCAAHFVNGNRYYTNTVSWLMGHAIYEGCESLGLYGVDMAQCTEYAGQKPSCELFIGIAAGRGINVTIPDECDLLKTRRLYGLEDLTPYERKLAVHQKELEEKLQVMHEQLNHAKREQVSSAAANNELAELVKSLNGDCTEALKGAVMLRQGNLRRLHDEAKLIADKADEELKLISGALEECRYHRQIV